MTDSLKIGPHTVEISSRDKIFFPEVNLTKGDLVDYYRRIATVMLPHLEGRPLTMERFPDGLEGPGFYQKEAPDYFPDWIERVTIELREEEGSQQQVLCNQAATLVYLANQACITPHVWLSKAEKLDYPDKLIFDLDPPGRDFEPVREAARLLRDILTELELVPFVMTTGSEGLHLVVPLDGRADFDAVRAFGRDLAELLVHRVPDRFTTETRKNKRGDRIFVDYLRNAYGQTAVPPYAVRPKPGAPVAAPLAWEELSGAALHPQRYTVKNIFRRLGQKADPWQEMGRYACSLDQPRRKFDRLRTQSGES